MQQIEDFTNSRETQILLSTSGPPIDNTYTREYVPERLTPVATLSHCTQDGRCLYDEHNDFCLEIPTGAIPYGVTIDISVYGLFQYRKDSDLCLLCSGSVYITRKIFIFEVCQSDHPTLSQS